MVNASTCENSEEMLTLSGAILKSFDAFLLLSPFLT